MTDREKKNFETTYYTLVYMFLSISCHSFLGPLPFPSLHTFDQHMKLTQSVLEEAPSFISPTEARVLSLRNLDLTSLDAIHVLQSSDIHSIIDITKNSISYLPEFPSLLHLETLILSNNHIRSVTGLAKLVNLQVLSMTYNEIIHFTDLEELKELPSLRSLYLTGNPVVKNKDYRLWCIWRFPTLQVIDFQRVKDVERNQASSIFDNNPDKVKAILSVKPILVPATEALEKEEKTVINDGDAKENGDSKLLTENDRDRLEKELEQAESMEEIQRIEAILLRGHL